VKKAVTADHQFSWREGIRDQVKASESYSIVAIARGVCLYEWFNNVATNVAKVPALNHRTHPEKVATWSIEKRLNGIFSQYFGQPCPEMICIFKSRSSSTNTFARTPLVLPINVRENRLAPRIRKKAEPIYNEVAGASDAID